MNFRHISVLLNESIEGLKIRPEGVYVDGTLGGAGHALEVCTRLGPEGRFIGIDQDEEAVSNGYEKLRNFGNVTIIRDNFRNFCAIMEELGIPAVHGYCWIWESHQSSWTSANGDFPTCKMRRWTCGWTSGQN